MWRKVCNWRVEAAIAEFADEKAAALAQLEEYRETVDVILDETRDELLQRQEEETKAVANALRAQAKSSKPELLKLDAEVQAELERLAQEVADLTIEAAKAYLQAVAERVRLDNKLDSLDAAMLERAEKDALASALQEKAWNVRADRLAQDLAAAIAGAVCEPITVVGGSGPLGICIPGLHVAGLSDGFGFFSDYNRWLMPWENPQPVDWFDHVLHYGKWVGWGLFVVGSTGAISLHAAGALGISDVGATVLWGSPTLWARSFLSTHSMVFENLLMKHTKTFARYFLPSYGVGLTGGFFFGDLAPVPASSAILTGASYESLVFTQLMYRNRIVGQPCYWWGRGILFRSTHMLFAFTTGFLQGRLLRELWDASFSE